MIDANSAREAAKRLFKKVSYQDGPLGSYQLSSLLAETYQFLKIPFKPSHNDIKTYEQTLDADKDGKVTLKDLQARAIEYLCSNNLISSISNTKEPKPSITKIEQQKIEQKNIGNSFSYTNNSDLQKISTNYVSSYNPNNYNVSNPYNPLQTQPEGYSYNYKSSFQTKPEINQASLNNFANQSLISYEKNSTYSKSNFQSNPGQQSERSFQYQYATQNDYSDNYVNQSYGGKNQYSNNYEINYNQQSNQPQDSYQYQQYQYNQQQHQPQEYYQEQVQYDQEQQRPYSETVRQYLSYVGQVFLKYANPTDYTVTQDQVSGLLTDTYAVLGRQGYEPSRQDVQTWMKLCDVNQDGKVEYQQYEYFVVKSLERSGLNLYD